jgi:Rieske Fe-S protein
LKKERRNRKMQNDPGDPRGKKSTNPEIDAAFKTAGGQFLVLVEVPQVKPEGPGVHTNFMLTMDDYPVVFDRLKERGCLVVDHRAEQRSVGEVSTYFLDPDGHHLQITAYSAEAFVVPPARCGKVVAGRVEDFPVGSVTHVKEGRFFLVRLEEGVLAINEICTHMHCILTYQPEHYRFYCACHYNRFTRKGEHIGHTPGVPPLHVYPIELVDGQIVVDTDRSLFRKPEEAERMVPVPLPLSPSPPSPSRSPQRGERKAEGAGEKP